MASFRQIQRNQGILQLQEYFHLVTKALQQLKCTVGKRTTGKSIFHNFRSFLLNITLSFPLLFRLELDKENRGALEPDPHYRVQSAPPTLGQPRFSFERHRGHQAPADLSYRRGIVPDDSLPTLQEHVDGRASVNYPVSRLSSSRYSLHSRGHVVSANRQRAALTERQNTEQYVVSGRDSNSSFYPASHSDFHSERGSFVVDSPRGDGFLSGGRQSKGESSHHGSPLSHSNIRESYNRQTAASDQRFSLYSDVQRSSQSHDFPSFPDDDNRPGRLDPSLERYNGAPSVLFSNV